MTNKGARIMDSKTGLDSKILLWLAGELGHRFQPEHTELCTNWRKGGGSCRCGYSPFDIEADTPEGAGLREKVVEWLATEEVMNVSYAAGGWWTFANDTPLSRTKAIIAAVEWLYDNKEHGNENK